MLHTLFLFSIGYLFPISVNLWWFCVHIFHSNFLPNNFLGGFFHTSGGTSSVVAHRWVGVSCGSLVGGLSDTLPYAKMLTDCEVLGDGVRGVLSHLRVGGYVSHSKGF